MTSQFRKKLLFVSPDAHHYIDKEYGGTRLHQLHYKTWSTSLRAHLYILIFGASGHIGWPLAQFLTQEAPSINLYLATSSPDKQGTLKDAFPKAQVVHADYTDLNSLTAALAGIEGVFVITPNDMPETTAMSNLTTALKRSNTAIHIIRLFGIYPELNQARIPKAALGPICFPYEHPIAKRILDESGLPITSVLATKTLIWPEHRVPFIDTQDIAEVAGQLFLSDNGKHIGAFHTMNNGHDWLQFNEVAEILSEVLGEPIAYDGSFEAF
ncbi:hypothetical protein BJY04DRAFT_224038 [Aspergillus karnatakaensis]|uniref:uncharacterized protein n=1 Tax=Aspergillus karnatakaensis TaxID=1810916 RepID=UPI003CCD065B